jgi:hypothetical protein
MDGVIALESFGRFSNNKRGARRYLADGNAGGNQPNPFKAYPRVTERSSSYGNARRNDDNINWEIENYKTNPQLIH